MTISTTVAAHREAGNGVKTIWSAPFPIRSNEQLYVETEAPDGTRTVRTPTSIVIGAATTGFTLASPAVPDGHICVMERRTALLQTRRLPDIAVQSGRSIEAGLDEAVMRDQELARGLARSISVVNDGSTLAPLPNVAARAGGLLGFDDAGSPAIFVATAGMLPASQTEAEAGVNNAKPMTALRTWQAIQAATDTVDVRHFSPATDGGFSGVSATGTVSNTAFQDALNTLAADGGGVLHIPSEGYSYRITQNLALGNGAAGVQSTWPSITIAGYDAASGFGPNNPSGGGALVLDGAQITAPGPQNGGGLRDLFLITPGNYPAGQYAVDLKEASYMTLDNVHFSIYGGHGLRMTTHGNNGNLFNEASRLLFRLDTGVGASGSEAMCLTSTGTTVDVASSLIGLVGFLPGRTDQVGLRLGYCDSVEFSYVISYPAAQPPTSTALNATTNAAGYAPGATVINLASAGTGAIDVDAGVRFGTDPNVYRVVSGDTNVANGGSITIAAPGLLQAIPAVATAISVVQGAAAVIYDFTVNPDFPQATNINHLDVFNGRIETRGTPSQLAKNNPNRIGRLNQQGGTPFPTGLTGVVIERNRLKEGVLYVNASTGNDLGASGLSPAGALRTIQRAYDLAVDYYDLEGDIIIQLADGTHTSGLVARQAPVGRKIIIQGNMASPGSCIISAPTDAFVANGGDITVRGVLISPSANANMLVARNGSNLQYGNIVFGSTVGAHVLADGGFTEETAACFITGGATQHIRAINGGRHKSALATTMLASITFTDFARVETGGGIDCAAATFPLNGNTVTGRRFNAPDGDPISAPAADFPGTVAGIANRRVRTLAQSAAPVSVGAVTTEAVLATIPIPAGAMGLNGAVRVRANFTYTNGANNKTLRIRLGGIGGTAFMDVTRTTDNIATMERIIQNRGAANSQFGNAWSGGAGGVAFGGGGVAFVTGAIDTAVAQDLVITGQKAVAGETLTLESYQVELMP